MSRSKLLQPEQNARPPKRAAAPEPVRSRPAGPGNRDLLSRLGSAKTMPGPVQAKMEETLGADFSRVRLYESPLVAELGAEAAASGDRVAFAPGKLDMKGSAGLELLGHELSHVASQARGEVVGSGFLRDPALERKADEDGARAMRAFDAVSGGEIAPLSAGPAPASPAGPVQAKKKTAGERLMEGYNEQNLAGQVETMRNMAITSAFDEHADPTEIDVYHRLVENPSHEFMDEMFRQQFETAQALVDLRNSQQVNPYAAKRQNLTPAEQRSISTFYAKNSMEATKFQAFATLLKDIGMSGDAGEEALSYFREKTVDFQRRDPEGFEVLREAQAEIIQSHDQHAADVMRPEFFTGVQTNNELEAKDFAKEWARPRARKRPGLLARLFGRR